MSLSPPEISQVAAAAGFSGDALHTATAVALAESGGDPQAKHTNSDGSIDRGLFQINSRWHGDVTDACAFNPTCAAAAAYKISGSGTNFSPWTTYTAGTYRNFLSAANIANTFKNLAGYASGQCTWYVAQLAPWIPGGYTGGNMGNAKDWAAHARGYGLSVDTVPHVGDVAVWAANAGGALGDGHVAIVTGVQGNGNPIVSEMNWAGGPNNATTRNVDANSAAGIIGYIHPPAGATTYLGGGAGGGAASAVADATGVTGTIKNVAVLSVVAIIGILILGFALWIAFRRTGESAPPGKLGVIAGGV